MSLSPRYEIFLFAHLILGIGLGIGREALMGRVFMFIFVPLGGQHPYSISFLGIILALQYVYVKVFHNGNFTLLFGRGAKSQGLFYHICH